MNNKNIISGIDIGTTKIVVIIAEKKDGAINIIGFGKSNSDGLERGIVVDISKTIKSITKAVKQAEEQANIEIESTFVGLTGDHITGINCTGNISISTGDYRNPAGERITQKNIDKVLEHSRAINLSPERKILHTLSKEFKVDERSGIKNPLGLSGNRLEANVHLVTIARNIENDLRTCIEECGIDIDGFILEPLASSASVLDINEKKLGSILIDIGGGTSDIIIFNNNSIIHTGAIPLGGENLTKDIAYGLNTSLENAEFIKCKNGVAKESLADEQKIIKIIGTNGREDKEISEKYLASIIQPRVNEIFNLAKNEVERSDYNGDFTFGIILTGGGASLNGIIDIAQEIFNMPVKIGIPDTINGKAEIINNPRYATGIGIIKYVIENKKVLKEQFEINNNNSSINTFISKIKNVFNKIN
ncbi:MAG: cell division protein FtsA [Candidatus Marinimicrobia bacterium]|nr:cell division protein FtsA [Candidatus Neomarinimicrobiota bacterium]